MKQTSLSLSQRIGIALLLISVLLGFTSVLIRPVYAKMHRKVFFEKGPSETDRQGLFNEFLSLEELHCMAAFFSFIFFVAGVILKPHWLAIPALLPLMFAWISAAIVI